MMHRVKSRPDNHNEIRKRESVTSTMSHEVSTKLHRHMLAHKSQKHIKMIPQLDYFSINFHLNPELQV